MLHQSKMYCCRKSSHIYAHTNRQLHEVTVHTLWTWHKSLVLHRHLYWHDKGLGALHDCLLLKRNKNY